MASPDDQTLAAAEEVRSASHRGRFDAAVVMGSGWAVLADTLGQTSGDLVVGDLPGFITPTAEGHLPQVRCITTPASRSTLVFLGRTHL
jgi:purine-nucleoside phosphorylase